MLFNYYSFGYGKDPRKYLKGFTRKKVWETLVLRNNIDVNCLQEISRNK